MIGKQYYAQCDDCHGRVMMVDDIDSAIAAGDAARTFGFTTDDKGKHRCRDCSARAEVTR